MSKERIWVKSPYAGTVNATGLFRPQARGRGPAAERLDERVRIAGPRHWLALLAAVCVILAGLAWSVLGHVDREVGGSGIITHAPYPSLLASGEAGTVLTPPPPIGTRVAANEVIARVGGPGTPTRVVRASVSGTIVSWYVARDEVVGAGQRIGLMEPNSSLIAYLFLPAGVGKQVSAGMPVRLQPGGTNPQSDGLLDGTVIRVLPYPVDEARLTLLTVQPHLVDAFLGGQARIEVDVRLQHDPSTATGLRWTNGTGPASQVTGGTVTGGSVIIGHERPISLLLGH
jgi:HlyD family secretion protein